MAATQVLVVEDEQLICELLIEALEDAGVTATCASNGADAIAAIADLRSLKVLITDINLGGGPDGFEVARVARAAFPEAFVLYVTGHAEGDLQARGVPGAMMIPKPYAPTTIAGRVAALVGLVGRYSA